MKNVVITGVSTGIGHETTRYLIEKGYYVFGSVRNREDASRLESDFPDSFKALQFDVRDNNSIVKASEYVASELAGDNLAALINNAGVSVPGPLMYLNEGELEYQLDVNVIGVFRVTNAFLPLLGAKVKPAPRPGKVINISSVSGLFNLPFNGPYCISKHALESMSDIYRRELMYFGIDLIVIEPGPIKTVIWEKARAVNLAEKFARTMYGPFLAKANQLIENTEKDALPVQRVAKLIYRVLNSNKPKTRYIVRKKALLFKYVLKNLPDRTIDRIIKRNLFSGKKVNPL